MAYRSSNPVFTNRNYAPTPQALGEMYATPGRLTLDDVILHTAGLLALVVVGGAVGWAFAADGNLGLGTAAAVVAIALSWLVAPRLARQGRLGASFAVPFSLIEGVFVGSVSKTYDDRFHGIVAQALIGTAAVFFVMLALHRSGRLRATPKGARIAFGATIAVLVVFVVDGLLNAFTSYQLPFVDGNGPLAVLFTLAVIALGAYFFTMDFANVEASIAQGAPTKMAWLLAYGLVISFVFVYVELLRLLGQLRR